MLIGLRLIIEKLLFACNGILFNHELLRGLLREDYKAVSRIALGIEDKIYLGNLDTKK